MRSLKASPVDVVRVVLGHRSEELEAHLAGEGVETLRNPRYLEGMLTSVQAGIAAEPQATSVGTAPPETEWLVIALGDQPSLRPETVRLLLAEARAGEETLLVPSYGGRRGHPLLIHARHREEIATLGGETGLRELFTRHPEAIRHIVVPDDAVLHDMDTPDDYQRELGRLRQRNT